MKILYLEPVGGIAGDMTVAALLDLGVPWAHVADGLAALGLPELRVSTERATRHAIAGSRFIVTFPGSEGGHAHSDHDAHPHSHGHAHEHGAAASTDHHAHPHSLGHDHGHEPSAPAEHSHRPYGEVRRLIEASPLADGVKAKAQRIFQKLAEAEGAVHDMPPDEVVFHEVGAWDSIADVVGAALALDYLAPDAVYCAPVPVGAGTVRTAHGRMPVPAPATLLLLKGFSIVQGGPAYERTTPTGAAILAALATPAPEPLAFVPERVGIGVGTFDGPEVANVLRAVEGRTGETTGAAAGTETIECAEANLDDANPEWIGYLMERLLEAGVLDVALLPIHMKKNRPGTQVQVLYAPELRARVVELLMTEATTLGVRYRAMERIALPREAARVATPWGEVAGKVARAGGTARFAPEFESCSAVARVAGVPLRDVYLAALKAYGNE